MHPLVCLQVFFGVLSCQKRLTIVQDIAISERMVQDVFPCEVSAK